jgi:hypothetical protein
MSGSKKDNTILLRLDDKEMRELDLDRAIEQRSHPGRVVSRAGLVREILIEGLRTRREARTR